MSRPSREGTSRWDVTVFDIDDMIEVQLGGRVGESLHAIRQLSGQPHQQGRLAARRRRFPTSPLDGIRSQNIRMCSQPLKVAIRSANAVQQIEANAYLSQEFRTRFDTITNGHSTARSIRRYRLGVARLRRLDLCRILVVVLADQPINLRVREQEILCHSSLQMEGRIQPVLRDHRGARTVAGHRKSGRVSLLQRRPATTPRPGPRQRP